MKEDIVAVNALCEIASIPSVLEFGEELFSAGAVLNKADPKLVIEGDFKTYVANLVRFGIGQVEVTTLTKVDGVKEKYIEQLEETKIKYGLDWAMLLITDVMKEDSVLLSTPYPRREKALIYPVESTGKYILKGVLSRKKQLLPEILRVLEEGL